ncbi:hypothetical protein SAMN04515674_105325 [Pseudarcicella hirudinis]|uniref:DUF6965 domain-containing protein n=1 Tax=Pseudarcicella hirudinis TaxID=1079859 RepID=A0A1I5T346_9BACT|nr:hypothetical protein [Pseudarcicella hirudinis]SFP76896.1 hypothetical protein SAMN04515674_105325 [Pseudarcicella hirudinis]
MTEIQAKQKIQELIEWVEGLDISYIPLPVELDKGVTVLDLKTFVYANLTRLKNGKFNSQCTYASFNLLTQLRSYVQ